MSTPNDAPSPTPDQPTIPGLEFPTPDAPITDEAARPTALDIARARIQPEDRMSEAYADLGGGIASAEQRSTERHLLGQTLVNYSQSRHYTGLYARGVSNPDTKKAGGLKKCRELAKSSLLAARQTYLESQGLPTALPDSPTEEQQSAFDEAVQAWATFRQSVLENDEARAALARELAVDVS